MHHAFLSSALALQTAGFDAQNPLRERHFLFACSAQQQHESDTPHCALIALCRAKSFPATESTILLLCSAVERLRFLALEIPNGDNDELLEQK